MQHYEDAEESIKAVWRWAGREHGFQLRPLQARQMAAPLPRAHKSENLEKAKDLFIQQYMMDLVSKLLSKSLWQRLTRINSRF